MKYFDFFKNKEIKILTIIFIILSFIHIIYASVVGRGLFIDGMWWVPHILDSLDENGYGFYLFDGRSRVFVKFISQLPMNIAYYLPFIGKNKDALIFFFSLPLFLFPFLITMFNLLLAKRSKRYDLVFAALFLYAFSILPSIMYAVVEAFIATSFLLLLWHYFVADIDYNWKDICAIVFLCIFSFSSTELVIPFGILIFLLSLKKIKIPLRDKNSVVRLFISITQLCASFVTFYMYMFVYEGIKGETLHFFNELNLYHPNGIDKMFYLEPFLVETVTLVVLIACFFLKSSCTLTLFEV